MIKKIIISLIFFTTLQANAFEDYIISTNGKLSNILIENNEIVDICPIITIANDKNILMVHPLKEGITCFTVVKNNKEKTTNVINSIMPFDTENCVKYKGNYLAGYSSEKRDTDIKELDNEKLLFTAVLNKEQTILKDDYIFRSVKFELEEYIEIQGGLIR